MKFTLTFDGELPASGNKSKPDDVWRIRNQFHPQLVDLWQKDRALQRLIREARIPKDPTQIIVLTSGGTSNLADWPIPEVRRHEIDLCATIQRGNHHYRPLVRASLDLACELEILFLRNDEPGALITQSGDLDNRIKTLFDGLRMPAEGEQSTGTPDEDPLYCLLESDTLINGLSVHTDRLLNRPGSSTKEVRLVVGVTVKVLHVTIRNMPLIGG